MSKKHFKSLVINTFRFTLLLLPALLIISCGGNREKKPGTAATDTIPAYLPNFNSDSAYSFVEKQLAFGPRVPGTKAHENCALWLEKTLKKYIPDVEVQQSKVKTYNNIILTCKNIIAVFHPERTDRVMLCAHWDSRPIADHDPDAANRKKPVPGANDGASGAGVLIELARIISSADPGVGVDLVLFDAEDYGQPEDVNPQREDTWCLGSQYWSKNPHKPGYTARFGILLDMVGAPNATFYKEQSSLSFAPGIVSLVWQTAGNLGYSDYFINQDGGSVTDDHIYVNTILKIPTVDIIQEDMTGEHPFFPYWHTIKDDMQTIDRKTLEAVGNTLLGVLHQQKPS